MSPGLKLGWAFFALCCVGMLGYALNRGLYVGSTVEKELRGVALMPGAQGYHVMIRRCRYLYPSGIMERVKEGMPEHTWCSLFSD